jgi:DNA repair protein RadA/Sms
MSKLKKTFFCQNCGAQSPKWIGRCPSCNEWNTYVEEIVQKESASVQASYGNHVKQAAKLKPISTISTSSTPRMVLPDEELNRVLGGGVVPGSLVLIGGEPGIGKSTLLLQVALNMAKHTVVYVSGEESEQQLKMRAERIGMKNEHCYVLTETSTQAIFSQLQTLAPALVVIDSIQTLQTALIESAAGSISQIRTCAAEFMRYAKETNTPVMLVGHITKDGHIAGPKVLEHMVDVVLQFEGDRNHLYRLLRSNKNRFGSTNELGIYEMYGAGLKEVTNPSEVLISSREEQLSGTAVAATVEGLRPFLVEVQALVSTAAYGTPQRSSTGFDLRRLNMLLAVMEKRCGFKLGTKDVFLNIAGGLRVSDPAIDLSIICAILSSNVDVPMPSNSCFAAEVGLSGELRPVNRIDQRIAEAQKLGFEKIYVSKYNKKGVPNGQYTIDVIFVDKVETLFKLLFAKQ